MFMKMDPSIKYNCFGLKFYNMATHIIAFKPSMAGQSKDDRHVSTIQETSKMKT